MSLKTKIFVCLVAIWFDTCTGTTFVWTGGGTNANWSTAANWSGGVVPTNNGTAAILLAGTVNLSPNVDTNWSITSLAFATDAGAFTLGGNILTIGAGGIFNSNASPQVVSNAITLSANQTWTAATNNLTLAGNVNLGANVLTVSGALDSTINGGITGAGALIKSGAGTVFLSASNSYSGGTTVSAGILQVQNSSALGATNAGVTVSSGAVLQLQGGVSVAGNTLSLAGSGISNGGALESVNGSNSWNGTITLAAASTINAAAGTLNLGGNIVNSTFTTTFTNNGTTLLAGALGGGTGGLTEIGTGTLSLSGANNYSGATTISGGTLQFGAANSASAASAVTVNAAGTLALNNFNESILSLAGAGSVSLGSGTLTVNPALATTYSGVMSGTGGYTQAGTATNTLSGASTFSGGVTINSGTISVKADNNLGSTNGTLTLNGGKLTVSVTFTSVRPVTLGANNGIINTGTRTLTLTNVINGSGALTKIGTGTLVLGGTNTYAGGTTNTAGTIKIASDSNLGNASGAFTFLTNSTLTTTASFVSTRNFNLVSGTATFSAGTGFTNTLNGVVSGAGALTQSGAGVLVLGGVNTFTNTLTISKGAVQMGGSGVLSSLVPVLITSASATLNLNGFNETIGSLASTAAGKVTLGGGFLTAGGNNLSTTNSAIISGSGGFTFDGAGTMILTGANTYTNTTTVGAGTLQLGGNSRLASTSPLVISNGATFSLTWNGTNYSQTVASLAGVGNVTLGGGTLTAGNAGTATFSGGISGTGAFTKAGAGTQIFSGTNSYSGATTVSLGNLQVNGAVTNSAFSIASSATLSGTGTVGTVTVNSGATNSPGGTATGTLNSGAETWAGGGNYDWEINDAAGTQGGSDGWDWLNISGALSITANAGSPFNLQIASLTPANVAGQVTNFNNTVTYIWTIASASGGISGFNAASFNLITNGFQNPLGAGTLTLVQAGNNLNLVFTTAAAAVAGGVQSGTLISSGSGTNTVMLASPVNPTNAFLIFNTSHNSPVPGGSMVRGWIASSNTVAFARATTESSTMNIQWYVASYSAGVRVQQGVVAQTNTVINVPLSPISATNQAFVTWSKTPDPAETAFTDSDPVVGQITSVSNLQFRVTSAPSSVPLISWQVVEFQNPAGIFVQQGSVTNLTGTNLVATATLAAPVNTNNTFILAGYRTSSTGTNIGARLVRAQWASASSITFDRNISGAPDNISEIFWQAVQLNDGSLVQGGSANLPAGVAATNVTFATSVNTTRAAAFSAMQPVGGQNTGRSPSTNGVLGVGSATLALTSGSQLTLTRNNTSDQADVGWFAIGFGPSSILLPATGGTAISADTTGGVYTSLVGPFYTELQSGNVGTGTIVLNAPAGFVFQTNGTLPTVLITRVSGSGANSLNINGVASGTSVAMTSVKTNALTFTVTSASSGGVTCSLAWQNVSVRPAAGTPLASGSITYSGTSVIEGATTNTTSWGYLNEVVGAKAKLAIATAPATPDTAGVDFATQPVIQIQDQFGNLEMGDNSDTVTVTNNGAGLLQGTTNITAIGGVAAFIGLNYLVASTIKLGFAANGLTGATSGNVVVKPAAASQVVIQTQPSASVTAGVPFAQQPVLEIEDPYGNVETSDNSDVITASLDQGSDVLYGTLTATAVNGVATFSNLSYQFAENITIDFTTGSLDPATCGQIAVNPAPASQLVIQTQPSANATAGAPFAQQPVIQIQDAYGNLCVTNNSTVVTASRDAGSGSGTLQGTVNLTAAAGLVSYLNLAQNVAGTISLDFNSSGLTGATSGAILVNPAAVAQLAFSTQPGSATVGAVFGTQPAVITQDAFGNNSVAGLASSLPVNLALTSGTGTLQGTASLDIGASAGNGVVTFANLEIDSVGSKQLTAGAIGLTSAVSTSFNVAQGSQSVTFSSIPNQTYGNAPFNLTASASSGLPVTFAVVSGPASVVNSNLTITGAGAVTVGASQAGNANYSAATTVDQSFTVTQAVLTVTANNQTRVYGATNPILTASYTGFVNGDTTNSLSGAPVLSTTAATNSSVAGSPYAIQITAGTLGAANYSFNLVNGALAVTPASSALFILASANPTPVGSNVTLTATLSAVAPGAGLPTGSVQFLTNGAAFLGAVTLTNGAASLATAGLAHGSNAVSAAYAGDGNFFGSTNTLVVYVSPVAAPLTVYRTAGLNLLIPLSSLATNWSDADGDPVSLTAINPVTTNGVSLVLINARTNSNGSYIITNAAYIGYISSSNVNDLASYSISDGFGGTNLGVINIVVSNPAGSSGQAQSVVVTGNSAALSFAGIPGYSYNVQRSTNLVSWVIIWTTNAPAKGLFQYTDNFPDLGGNIPASAYYRLVWSP